MVSIPDWAKFSRLHDIQFNQSQTNSHLSKYYRQQEEETIRQAEEQGYFIIPTLEFLLDHCTKGIGSGKENNVENLVLLQLSNLHVRRIGEIGLCSNLRICNLSNNYLCNISGLASCRHMLKLDLHGNQISSEPGMAFWSGFRYLKFLHLHDNPLGKFDIIHNISTCPKLIGLTLYDTPLSLRKNYRHHIVNSIWTLKVLDHHIVSDEEIIEDSNFGGVFRTMHPSMVVNICPTSIEDTTYENEVWILRQIEARINLILARRSPVIIIQRYMRGYIARKKNNLGMQRLIRKGIQATTSDHPQQHPSTPLTDVAQSLQETAGDVQIRMSMDYDTYMENRRPGSNVPSDVTVKSLQQPVHSENIGQVSTSVFMKESTNESEVSRKKTNIVINLAKLESGTLQNMQEDAIDTIFTIESREKSGMAESMGKFKKPKKSKRESRQRKVKNTKQFFGPVVATEDVEQPVMEDGDDFPITQYRLHGQQPNLHLVDATTELILERKQVGRHIREAELEYHSKPPEHPLPTIPMPKYASVDRKIYNRVHTTMGMSCLLAVQKAYKDREKAEKTAARMEYILSMREERMRARERISMYHEDKRKQALTRRDRDRTRLLDGLERHEIQRLNYLDKRMEVKNKANDVGKSHRIDQNFVSEFNNQHTSVSNALLRHDRQAKVQDNVHQRKAYILEKKSQDGEQQTMVKKFMEHRNLMRQTDGITKRSTIGTKMLHETNDRLMEAKQRVAQIKARTDTVQAFYPLPPNNVPNSATSAPKGMSRWEASALVSGGRIGRHQTVFV